jgi:hypothetical protein
MLDEFSILNVRVRIAAGRPRWRRLLRQFLRLQADGFTSEQAIEHNLDFCETRDIDTKSLGNREFVPGHYSGNALFLSDERQGVTLRRAGPDLTVYTPHGYNPSLVGLLRLLLAPHGMEFIHGAGVIKDDQATLVIAFGGIGKTAFISEAMRRPGALLLGDDMLVVGPDGLAHPYPRPFCLYSYHSRLFPEFFSRERPRIRPYNLVTRILRRAYWELGGQHRVHLGFASVPPALLFSPERIATRPAPIHRIVLLSRDDVSTSIRLRGGPPLSQFVAFTSNVVNHEFRSLVPQSLAWHAFSRQSTATILGRQERTLASAFSHAEVLQAYLPPSQDLSEAAKDLAAQVLA